MQSMKASVIPVLAVVVLAASGVKMWFIERTHIEARRLRCRQNSYSDVRRFASFSILSAGGIAGSRRVIRPARFEPCSQASQPFPHANAYWEKNPSKKVNPIRNPCKSGVYWGNALFDAPRTPIHAGTSEQRNRLIKNRKNLQNHNMLMYNDLHALGCRFQRLPS